MLGHSSLLRQILLIHKLRQSNGYSYVAIQEYMQKKLDGKTYSERTFFRDVKTIRKSLKIDIEYDRKNNVHHITTDADELNIKALESFEMLNVLMSKENYSAYMHFENRRPDGVQHFQILLQAIKDHRLVRFKHQKYYEEIITDRLIEPYTLKEFKGRWYLLGKDLKEDKLKTFGLDKMSQLEIKPKKFTYPADFDPQQMFKNCFGIIIPQEGEQIQNVILSFNPEEGKYIRSYKLHESQVKLIGNDDEYKISLDVYVTHDLIMEILSHGEEVEVIEPEGLKTKIKNHLIDALNYY
jgi:predicted DNA-binding transcriptional regulator YafY